MSGDEIRNVVVSADLFAGQTGEAIRRVVEIAAPCRHAAREVVVRQGDPSDSFSVVSEGTFEVYLWDELLAVERPITVLGRGDIFGDMGLITGEPRSASVRAQEAGATLRFERAAFLQLLESMPGLSLALARTLVRRLDAANKARGMRLERLSNFALSARLIGLLPLQVILRHQTVPVALEGDRLTLAIVDPTDLVARNTAAEFLGEFRIEWVCISQRDFEVFRGQRLYGLAGAAVAQAGEEVRDIAYLRGSGEVAADTHSLAARQLDDILRTALAAAASDIHLEPGAEGVDVRARIDGHLVPVAPAVSFEDYRPLVSRVKILGDMDITERRLPQDAAIRLRYGGRHIDLRVSTVPTPNGESVVCRILDPQHRKLELRELIAQERVAQLVEDLFLHPAGLVLVTGPTGAGKTTTLYAGLQARLRRTPSVKIVTAEDPVEYEIGGVTQVQVNLAVGLTFERILRSVLRQDPDVLLVGEIRDKVSMDIALEAALTGHLIVSSLHTNDALETVVRLRQRGAPGYAIAAGLRGVVSQRLLPRLCGACARVAARDAQTLERLQACGVPTAGSMLRVWEAPGCERCRMTGRKGRAGVFEVLVMSDAFRSAIEAGAPIADLRAAVPAETFLPMRRYAAYLVDHGMVSAKDVLALFPVARVAGTTAEFAPAGAGGS